MKELVTFRSPDRKTTHLNTFQLTECLTGRYKNVIPKLIFRSISNSHWRSHVLFLPLRHPNIIFWWFAWFKYTCTHMNEEKTLLCLISGFIMFLDTLGMFHTTGRYSNINSYLLCSKLTCTSKNMTRITMLMRLIIMT